MIFRDFLRFLSAFLNIVGAIFVFQGRLLNATFLLVASLYLWILSKEAEEK